MELVSGWGPVPALALVSALLPRFTRGSVIVTRAVPFARTMKLFMSPACGPIGLRNPSCLPAGLKCGPALSNAGPSHLASLEYESHVRRETGFRPGANSDVQQYRR